MPGHTHPHLALAVQRAVVAVGRLRVAWEWTGEQLVPGPTRFNERALADHARARLDTLVAAERRDRVAILREGRIPYADTKAPIRIRVADARTTVHRAVRDAAWLVTSAVHRSTLQPYQPGLTPALPWLAEHVGLLDSLSTAEQVADMLESADREARAAVGVGDDRVPLKARCPGCGRQSLARDTGSPVVGEWEILCTRFCPCRGVDCACKRPVRYPGARVHRWPEVEWRQLARLLDTMGQVAA